MLPSTNVSKPSMRRSRSEEVPQISKIEFRNNNKKSTVQRRVLNSSISCPIGGMPERSALRKCDSDRSDGTKKKVTFSQLELRKYPIILGDHPGCVGPPLTIGWEYQRGRKCQIEDYEERKPSDSRRNMHQLEINEFMRADLLKRSAGVTDKQMKETVKQNQKIQKQRMRTVTFLPFSKLEERAQSLTRKIKGRSNKAKSSLEDSDSTIYVSQSA